MVIGELCLVNPNSRDSVKTVLKHIRTMSRIPEQRKWVTVWSDGVPYVHMTDPIESIFTCSARGTEIDAKGMSFQERVSECHPDTESSFKRLFDCIIPKPGPGHIEINMAKVLVDVGWMTVISRFCNLLGFRSPKAQLVVKTGSNRHRSRSILFCVLQGITSDLLLAYVKMCRSQNQHPNSRDFFIGFLQLSVIRYMFLFDFTFTYFPLVQ